jgi:thiamine-phosphate pyrophosphorylase
MLPRLWLMTDDTRGDAEAAIGRLPPGSAVIFRHYAARNRDVLGAHLHEIARAHAVLFLVAGDPRLAARLNADGFHAPEALASRIPLARRLLPRGLVTMAAHGADALATARQMKPDALIVSPVFPTSSHPGAPTLGPVRFAALVQQAPVPVIALGGMTAKTIGRLRSSGAKGFAGLSLV